MEHALLVFKYFLRFILPDTPHWVFKEKEFLLILNEDFNQKKEEKMNNEMKNYVKKSFLNIREFVERENRKNREVMNKFTNNQELLKKCRKELVLKSVELNDIECILENLEEELMQLKKIRKMEIEYAREDNNNKILSSRYSKIEKYEEEEQTHQKQNIVYSTDLNKLYKTRLSLKKLNKENEKNNNNGDNKSSKSKVTSVKTTNRPRSFTSEKSGKYHKIVETQLEFKFDKIFRNMIEQILLNRNIILDDDKDTMKTLIYKVYIIHIFKNTFEKIEREIFNKKLAKLLNNINQPITLCNSCSEKGAIVFCWECQEKLCYDCKNIHNSNSFWVNHKLQKFIIPEYRENVIDKVNELEKESIFSNNKLPYGFIKDLENNNNINFDNNLIKSPSNLNQNVNNEINNNKNNFYITFKGEKKEINYISDSVNRSKGFFDTNSNIIHNKKITGENNSNNPINHNDNESESNNISYIFNNIFNKIRGKTGITKNILLKEIDNHKSQINYPQNNKNNFYNNRVFPSPRKTIFDKGVLLKFEGFSFPITTQSYNYKNLNFYFQILYREYISKNGINNRNNIETKFIIENQIYFYTNLKDYPLNIIKKEFSQLILKSTFNIEEQFFINRISFLRFKQCGANLTFHDVFSYLKILQCGTFEEKLRLLILILDINDTKIVLKSEFEKLISCLSIQNYSPDYRLKNIIDLFFEKNIYYLKSDTFFHLCLKDNLCKEVICEILQVYLDDQ